MYSNCKRLPAPAGLAPAERWIGHYGPASKRCAASEKFQKVDRNIARYLQQKAKKTVTLNEAKFLKERTELNADKEEEKAIEKLNENPSGIDRDFYLDEVFNITTDYMDQAQVVKAN